MKKEKKGSTFLVIIIMIVLIIFIAAPPVLRKVIKDEDTATPLGGTEDLSSMQALICQRQVSVGTMIYNINVTSSYQNNILNKVTINYTLPTTLDPTIDDSANAVVQEMNNLRNTGVFTETTTTAATRFEATKALMDQYNSDPIISNYNQSMTTQQANFVAAGYTCQVMNG